MKLFETALIARTGNLWKLYVSFAILMVAAPMMGVGLWLLDPQRPTSALLLLVAILATLASFLWAIVSIRCPACDLKLVWWAMTRASAGAWLTSLMQLSQCPRCGRSYKI